MPAKRLFPLDKEIDTQIEEFENGPGNLLEGCRHKHNGGRVLTTQTVKNVDGESVLDFHVEENLGDREPKER
ncbi:unnamed protein product [Rhizophagus irregularis]|nr:unnamed protein product [Rhizophagus irregularis]